MPLLSASTALLLLAAAPTTSASSSSDFHLHEGLPSGFKVDGKLDEWKQPPSLLLGGSNQVAGKSKVASPADLSAKIWLALGTEGLAVAGEVRDDRVQLSTKPEHINDDHVEIWLSLPQPAMPPIAFVNQFGDQELPTAESCKDTERPMDDIEACQTWWKEQVEHRKQLVRAFTLQYGLLSGSVVRYGPKDTVGSIRYEPMDGGYRFEALIPPSAFPRTAEAPLRNLKVLVDLVDSDEGKGKLETFLSSSPRRKFGDPSTFHAVALAKPLRFGAWPDLFERALKANESASYQPGPDVQALQAWINPARGYQYAPEEDSPIAVDIDLSKVESVGKLGDVELVSVPGQSDGMGGIDRWMVSRRGQQILDTQNIGTSTLRLTPRAPGLHILRVYEGTQSPLGTGACGACPELDMYLVKMDAQGRFSTLETMDPIYSQGEEITWKATPDLSRIEASVSADEAPPKLVLRYTFDPKTGAYKKETFEQAQDGVAGDTTP
ncbi:hypothetical protein [Vitiosangium sp. GDMCC 1.1324]|uniref:hypothetical protein n=1 Tax=Vitiosangium sp. (strain GDMCC 1.1324) TaxID=2138576 RepID=UPI000D3424B2|nr:hypothetical protein [Vitiosangium sp. GDMCC 1.1324]PTL76867.1 hypothetical protein DAT35_47190 [Vitiosangium sp. GDMCC 1.1324]